MEIKHLSVDSLIPYALNARTHSDAQVAQIAASIKEFGFTNPVLTDIDNGIIAGHGRVMAARKLGMATVPCIELAHLTETQKKAYILADNKIALNSGWDVELIKLGFDFLELEGFDLELTGFSAEDMARISDDTDELNLKYMSQGGVEDVGQRDNEKGSDDNPDEKLFPFSVVLTYEQRDIVFSAIKRARDQHGVESSGEAIFSICKEWGDEGVQ
jgi:hypothetical protein